MNNKKRKIIIRLTSRIRLKLLRRKLLKLVNKFLDSINELPLLDIVILLFSDIIVI